MAKIPGHFNFPAQKIEDKHNMILGGGNVMKFAITLFK